MVGAVIVHEGRIIGEGWHQQYGGPHAEVLAIEAVKDARLLPESTMYVSLEPCAHHGKTPPCADLICKVGMKRVVIAMQDPFGLVAGKGIQQLKNQGIDVEVGLLEAKARELNKRFLTAHSRNRPFIVLKWAQTSDGFIAREDGSSKWISGSLSRQLVHKLRSEEQAIMVGTKTALLDDPSLTVRDWAGLHPTRVVIDRSQSLPDDLKLFNAEAPTLYYSDKARTLPGTETVAMGADLNLEKVLRNLWERGLHSLMVEGGTALLQSFILAGLWDEAYVFTGNIAFEKGIPAPVLGSNFLKSTLNLEEDLLAFYTNSKNN
jgi:diaminohydroxyphosphoribosylaminopyrimidine deaminase/5-amino-6-(5-phosphoribosylamino)uracil reductase